VGYEESVVSKLTKKKLSFGKELKERYGGQSIYKSWE